jgi:D-alanyl-D-alanine carboxypeptidase (penicillin-binding protein 5/6)
MQFFTSLLLLSGLVFSAHAALPVAPAPQIEARAWLLIDSDSGLPLAQKTPDAKVEPASLTKLMTAYLAFSAIKEGRLTLTQALPVSENAWRAEGSRMFLDPKKPAVVEDLLKGMIVQSGNDACVTLAEAIAGSEEAFAAMMNDMAKRLGMGRTHFVNATGLPHPNHFTSAKDLSVLATALIRDFPEFYKIYALKEFAYNGITQPNRNRLLFIDPTVDGVKTGHTEAAGYCLISSALRDKRRLLSVVLGTASDSARASESQKLLNWGYISYDAVSLFAKDQAVATLRVWKGAQREVKAGFTGDLMIAVPKGYAEKVKSDFVAEPRLIAPIEVGQKLGTLKVSIDGQAYGEYPVIALEKVELGNIFVRLFDTIRLWFV